MSQTKKTASVAPKAPKKLIPRTAPKAAEVLLPAAEVVVPDLAPVAAPVVTEVAADVAVPAKVAPAAKAKAKVAAKPALTAAEKAAAAPIKTPLGKASKPVKAEKPPKAKKIKLVRDSYAMPEAEYAQIAVLKKSLAAQGIDVKKSELLRAGIAVLVALDAAELQTVMSHIERIKTGRPSK